MQNKLPKEHCFKNHVEGFLTQIKRNNSKVRNTVHDKREIVVVSYGMNTGSEVNGERPSIVYKTDENTLGDDVTVIPLTSALHGKQTDKFDVLVSKDEANKLFQNSFARVRQLKAVSIKRIGKTLGKITDEVTKQTIDSTVRSMLGFD